MDTTTVQHGVLKPEWVRAAQQSASEPERGEQGTQVWEGDVGGSGGICTGGQPGSANRRLSREGRGCLEQGDGAQHWVTEASARGRRC